MASDAAAAAGEETAGQEIMYVRVYAMRLMTFLPRRSQKGSSRKNKRGEFPVARTKLKYPGDPLSFRGRCLTCSLVFELHKTKKKKKTNMPLPSLRFIWHNTWLWLRAVFYSLLLIKKKKAFISRSNNFVSYQQFFFVRLRA